MISRCYLEITNVCNLNCMFCPKTDRAKHFLSPEEFDTLTSKLVGEVKFLYFHLMGEPFLHPHLPEFIRMARSKGFVPVLTTNGTLLPKSHGVIEALPHKIQISLHSHEGNAKDHLDLYIKEVVDFAKEAALHGILVVMRLWNQGGYEEENERILELMEQHLPRPWTQRHDGWKLAENLYIEFDGMFEWPDGEREEYGAEKIFCYALRNQVGVLVDGSVVPCCLDHGGDIVLGNLFDQSLGEIISSPRAKALYDGFTNHTAVEPLCRRCGYAAVSKRYRE